MIFRFTNKFIGIFRFRRIKFGLILLSKEGEQESRKISSLNPINRISNFSYARRKLERKILVEYSLMHAFHSDALNVSLSGIQWYTRIVRFLPREMWVNMDFFPFGIITLECNYPWRVFRESFLVTKRIHALALCPSTMPPVDRCPGIRYFAPRLNFYLLDCTRTCLFPHNNHVRSIQRKNKKGSGWGRARGL